MAHPLRPLALLLCGILAATLPAPPGAAQPLYPCSDPAYGFTPNGDGSYRYEAATPGVEDPYGNCVGAYGADGNTPRPPAPPTVEVCEGPYLELQERWWDDGYRLVVGGKVRVNDGSCTGTVVERDVPVCDVGVDPIFSQQQNADGSRRVTFGAVVHTQNAAGCRQQTVQQTVTVPAPPRAEACETAADAGPNGDGSYHYRAGATASVNGGSCTGEIAEGNTPKPPAPPSVEFCEGPYADLERRWWDDGYRLVVGGKVRVNDGSCTGTVVQRDVPVCEVGVDPILSQQQNADGSRRVTVGATIRSQNAAGCREQTTQQSFTIPAPPSPPSVEVCEQAYEVTPTGYGSYHVRVAYKVSVNGGSCSGVDYAYDLPPY